MTIPVRLPTSKATHATLGLHLEASLTFPEYIPLAMISEAHCNSGVVFAECAAQKSGGTVRGFCGDWQRQVGACRDL